MLQIKCFLISLKVAANCGNKKLWVHFLNLVLKENKKNFVKKFVASEIVKTRHEEIKRKQTSNWSKILCFLSFTVSKWYEVSDMEISQIILRKIQIHQQTKGIILIFFVNLTKL